MKKLIWASKSGYNKHYGYMKEGKEFTPESEYSRLKAISLNLAKEKETPIKKEK